MTAAKGLHQELSSSRNRRNSDGGGGQGSRRATIGRRYCGFGLVERVALDPGAKAAKLDRILPMYERSEVEGGRARVQRGERQDPEKARRYQAREEQARSL
jgi:hypothetical protein